MTPQEVERSVLALCFHEEPSAALLQQLGDAKVWLLYRDMVRDRLRVELRAALPRTCQALGMPTLERLFALHLAEQPPRTRFFREIALEFVRSSLPRLRTDASLPAFAVDLMTYEAAVCEVSDADARVLRLREFSFERPAVLSPALRLLELRHAVHEHQGERGEYRVADVLLCVHRGSDQDRARVWPLDGATFALLSAFERPTDETVAGALQRVGREQGFVVDAAFVDRLCTTLSRFIEAGLVLGSA